VDPRPFKLRQLGQMADGRDQVEWNRAAVIAAGVWNAIRDPKKRRTAWQPADFHPYIKTAPKPGIRLNKQNRATLKKLFTSQQATR